ncbi:hypothetical protein HYC85_020611 [Camellia sinensis]|uniref:Uncharacterized protein n=1 Tax=Camellia sinensis TaxID=4442 RepID=A0A7J7GQ93_CAMSI|nr:hypothetical protein HYC85_020611 [Camellia sinensis]
MTFKVDKKNIFSLVSMSENFLFDWRTLMLYQQIRYGLELYQLVHLVTLSTLHIGVMIP